MHYAVSKFGRSLPIIYRKNKNVFSGFWLLAVNKLMELENFKSYAGVQVIGPVHPRLSSVVSSGQSNVTDALFDEVSLNFFRSDEN
jgi:hypothetical protein